MVFPHAIPHRRCALRTQRAHTHAFSMLWACAMGSDVRRTRGSYSVTVSMDSSVPNRFCRQHPYSSTAVLSASAQDGAVTGTPGKRAGHSVPPPDSRVPPPEASNSNSYICRALQRTTGFGFTLAVLVGAQLILYEMGVSLNTFVFAALYGAAQKSQHNSCTALLTYLQKNITSYELEGIITSFFK